MFIRKLCVVVAAVVLSPGSNTKEDDDSQAEHTLRHKNQATGLFMAILLTVTTIAQAWAQPYKNADGNKAELFSLAATYAVTMFGLGCSTLVDDFGNLPDAADPMHQYVDLLSFLVYCMIGATVAFCVAVSARHSLVILYDKILASDKRDNVSDDLRRSWRESVSRIHLDEALTRRRIATDEDVNLMDDLDEFSQLYESLRAVTSCNLYALVT